MNAHAPIRLLTAALAGLGLTALLAGVALSQPTQAPPGDAARGKTLFMQNGCWTCHGTIGQGNRFSGPAIAPHPVPYAAYIRQLRQPAQDMPPYAPSIVSDADAAAIYAYLQSIPAGKPAADIPLLRGVTGSNGKP